jgi:hypothetical protein
MEAPVHNCNAHHSIPPTALCFAACLTIAACAEEGPTGLAEVEVESPPATVDGRWIPGPGGIEGLMQDIEMLRAIVADRSMIGRVTTGTTWAASVAVEELLAELEVAAGLSDRRRMRDPGGLRLSSDYYDPRVSGSSSILFYHGTEEKVKFFGTTSCYAFQASSMTASIRSTMRASTTGGGTWFYVQDYPIAPSANMATSGGYEVRVYQPNNAYYMNSIHYCAPGFGDRFTNTSFANAQN